MANLSSQDVELLENFFIRASMNVVQQEQCQRYVNLLLEWNQKFNLTRITSIEKIMLHHFEDSLAVGKSLVLSSHKIFCDVGSGGGFPGIPLKICYPEIEMILLEVNQKKIAFLNEVINALGLKAISVCGLDWRTFLRTGIYDRIDYFLARASLPPKELLRAIKPGSLYGKATIIYWASRYWQPSERERSFITKTYHYNLKTIERKLVLFQELQK